MSPRARALLLAGLAPLVALAAGAGTSAAPGPLARSVKPQQPRNLRVTRVTASSVSLAWSASRDPHARPAIYRVYRNGRVVLRRDAPPALLERLACATTYAIAVDAVDAAGNSSGRARTSATTAPCAPTKAPHRPHDLRVAAATETSVTLVWKSDEGGAPPVAYGIYRDGALVAASAVPTATLAGLGCGRTYAIDVDAVDRSGTRSDRASVTAATSPCPPPPAPPPPPSPAAPQAPRDLTVTEATRTSVTLAWKGPDRGVPAVAYGIYRDGALAATSAVPTATLAGLDCGTSYAVEVDAVARSGRRSDRASVTAATSPCPPPPPPDRPTGLGATAATETSVTLGWKPAAGGTPAVAYGIYRDGTLVATSTVPTAVLSGLECGKSYTVEVDAADASGDRSDRASATVATAACPPPPPQPGDLFVARDGWDGTWSHLAATYDGTTLRLYVNGVEVSQRAVSGALDPGVGPLRIGGNSIWSEWFKGLIDEVRVYDRPLDAAEIQHDMESPVAPAPGLVAGFSFGEGSGTLAHDLSGNPIPNDGVIDGATWVERGRFGGALAFDGTDDSILIPDATSLDLSSGMTLEAWVDSDRLTGWQTVVLKEQPKNMVYALYANTDSDGPSANVVTGGNEQSTVGPEQLPLNSCARVTPCQTFDRAYRAAQPGQVVDVASGTYPLQTIGVDPSKTSQDDVVIRAAPGRSVTVDGLDVFASHLTFRDFAVEGDWTTHNGTDDVTFRDLAVHGAIFTQSSSNIHVIGGSVGGIQDSKPQIGSWPDGTQNRNIVIDGVRFHDIRRTNDSVHIECLLVGGVDGLVIRNSRFENCDVFDVSIAELNGSPPVQNVLIENNFFGAANGFYSLFFNDESTSLSNVVVRNNSSPQEMYFAYGTPQLNNVSVIANIAPTISWHCDTRITYAYNVWQGATCGPTDLNADAGFRDAANGDLHLLPDAAAIDRGDPASFPADDIDGQPRPLGPAPDAGADEAR